MSLIWMDGFDAYGTDGQDVSYVLTSSLYASGIRCVADADTRTGRGYAVRFLRLSDAEMIKAFEVKDELIVGFAWKVEEAAPLRTICQFLYDDHFGTQSTHLSVYMTGDGAVSVGYFTGAGTAQPTKLFDSGPNILFPNVWHYIEVRVKFGASTGEIQVRVDGQTCVSGVGRTTNTDAPALCNMFRLGTFYLEDNNTAETFVDDLYILDTEGTEFNDFLGDVVIHTVMPNEDGSLNQLSQFGGSLAKYTAVDDIPPDGDTSYVFGNTIGQQERYGVDPLPTNVINVLAVSVHARVKKDAAGASGLKLLARVDGVNEIGPTEPVTTQYVTRAMMLERAPGGSAWTKAKAEAMEIGFEVA